MNKVTVAISGGFDFCHTGHLAYIKEAMKLGDELIIILSRDDQLRKKKGYCVMPFEERKAILKAIIETDIDDRDKVVMNTDYDITSCQSLRHYKPDIFAKGGDTWDTENLPEQAVCEELGIKVVFGVGGFNKAQSSSNLMEKAIESYRSSASKE